MRAFAIRVTISWNFLAVLGFGNLPQSFLLRGVECVLHVSFVPSQAAAERRDEIARLIGVVDRWDWVLAHADKDRVSALELAPIPAVKGYPSGASSVLRDAEFDFDAIRENYRTEG